ncbi:hypothetical protein SBV1_1710013 [Verrucomicrobia bacterium]|nr:hypothetical protein SBV1_1710013 [Verrucomicrobiota bacterium]
MIWTAFTPCTVADGLLETVSETAKTRLPAMGFGSHRLVRALISLKIINLDAKNLPSGVINTLG